MKSFLKKWLGPILIVVTLAIVLIVGLVNGVLVDAVKSVLNADPFCMLMCVLCYMAYILCNASAVKSFLKREGYDLKLKDSVHATFTGVYYSNITPGATGGQPMQIYQLSKYGIPVGTATSSIASFFIAWHLMRVVLVIGFCAFYWNFVLDNLGKYWIFLLVGFAYNLVLITLWLVFSFSRKPVQWIVKAIAKVMTWLHLTKNPEKTVASMTRTADKFHTSMQHLKSHRGEIFKQLIFGTLHMLLLISIMYFAYRGVGLSGASFGQVMVMALCQYVSAAYMPTPGGSGAQEGIFGLYFGKMIPGSKLFAVMMIWRFMSYYLGLTLGAIINLSGRKKGEKALSADEAIARARAENAAELKKTAAEEKTAAE